MGGNGDSADRRIPVEELIQFPTSFSFKAISHHTLTLPQKALDATRSALSSGRTVELQTRLSGKGTYVSVTLTTTLESADELRSVYEALWRLKGVITVL